MKPGLFTLLLGALALGTACRTHILQECPASAGSAATCAEACANLDGLDCQAGASEEECMTSCEAASAGVAADVLSRVLSCYSTVDSCRQVDGCSRACGADGGPVPWNPETSRDAGPADAGADADAGD